MSEAKRVPLQTLEFPESLGYAAKKDKKGDKGKQFAPSFRFTLTLPESNEKTCPEFNYAQLLKAAEKKRRKETKKGDENATNGLDPFDDDDEDKLVDMARRFEAKYGTATLGKKRRKYDDYVDLGAGYDENDSFIDNTDAYDEIVPEEVTTAHGGFYINSGALEFKTSESHSVVNNNNNNNNDKDESSESSEEDTEGADSPKRSEKRVLSSSDDEETDDVMRENPQKKQRIEDNIEKKLNHENSMKKKKKQDLRPHNSQQDLDILNRRKEKTETDAEGGTGSEDQDERKKTDKLDLQRSKNLSEKKFAKKSSTNGLDVKQVDLKKLDDKDNNIDDAIESVVNAARVDDESSRDTSDSGKSRGIVGSESEGEDVDKEEAPLPESLPEDVKEIINTLKSHAETNKEGKNKFFNTVINTALFSLEKKLSMLNQPSIRQQTYAHLSHFLPCSKVTLVNRVKKLCLQDVEYKVRESLQRLKAIIDAEMPAVMEKHMKDCKKVADEKWYDGSPADAESTDDEDASKNPDKSKIPRRRFPWTEKTKRLVYDIANARRQYFKILRPRKESMESFVKTFMSTKVLPLWPPGYVRLETLLKYSNIEPVAKKKSKKLKDMVNTNSLASSGPSAGSTGPRVDAPSANNSAPQDKEKSLTSSTKTTSGNDNFSGQGSTKLADLSSDRKQQLVSKPKDKNRENSTMGHHQDNFAANVNNSTIGKISVVPTAQLMAQKPVKNHMEKFNLMDLANSSLSITPMNDYQKAPSKVTETKKDVVSITAYTEHSNVHSNVNEVPQQSGHVSGHRTEVSFSGAQLQHSNYPASNQQQSHSKPLCLKHRLLQDNVDAKGERRIEEKEFDAINKTDKKDKKRERCPENKHRSQEAKKRKKEQKIMEQQHVGPVTSDLVPIPQQTPLSKEEQEQRQIEETVAATNFLSQIINDDASPRSTADKRKDSGLSIDEPMSNLMQQSDQEKDVQMVIKELQELQEMKYSSGHSPMSSGIQKSGKSNTQYATYQDEYQRFYVKKEDKLRSKDEVQW